MCLSLLIPNTAAAEKCMQSLRAIRYFDGFVLSPVVSIWGDDDIRTDPLWKYAVKKYEKTGQRTFIQIKESNSDPVSEYEFIIKNRKIAELNVKVNSRQVYKVTLTPDCQIQQIVRSPVGDRLARVGYDRELCDRIAKQKIDRKKVDQCRDVFSDVKAALDKRNTELAINNLSIRPIDVDHDQAFETLRPYLQILSNCEQLRISSDRVDIRDSGATFKHESTTK